MKSDLSCVRIESGKEFLFKLESCNINRMSYASGTYHESKLILKLLKVKFHYLWRIGSARSFISVSWVKNETIKFLSFLFL